MISGAGPGLLPPFLLLLLLPLLLPPPSEASCPAMCLCTSDTASCSSGGLSKVPQSLPAWAVALDLSHNHLSWLGAAAFRRLPRLESLHMAHNRIDALSPGAFANASGLRHLDMSSNRLQTVEQHYFQGLWRLEELLLYNNKIVRVEAGALGGLSSLKKAYFSLNHITHFPFFAVGDRSHPFLSMLDLSSNRLSRLPWDQVKELPHRLQRGLHLHNNTLLCDCAMYAVFWHWELRGYASLADFAEQHTCSVTGDPRATVRFLRHTRFFSNCTLERVVSAPTTVLLSKVKVYEGSRVRLDCITSLNASQVSFSWAAPQAGALTEADVDPTLMSLHPDGTLDLHAARVNDSGLYVCTAVDGRRGLNATREVELMVVAAPAEAFNTGYTTLLGCVVTLLLVLAYLYMTPCRCRSCSQPKAPATAAAAAYDLEQAEALTDKRVAFLDPGRSHGGRGGAGWSADGL